MRGPCTVYVRRVLRHLLSLGSDSKLLTRFSAAATICGHADSLTSAFRVYSRPIEAANELTVHGRLLLVHDCPSIRANFALAEPDQPGFMHSETDACSGKGLRVQTLFSDNDLGLFCILACQNSSISASRDDIVSTTCLLLFMSRFLSLQSSVHSRSIDTPATSATLFRPRWQSIDVSLRLLVSVT